MNAKTLFCLAALAGLLISVPARAVTTTKNVDIMVTHGAALTTSTYINTTGATVPAGTPLLMAQAFRRGDVFLNSNCAAPRNASTHNPLIWQHDNTSTRRENGDDGSVRHWSFGVLTDAAVPAGGHYTIEWVSSGAACPAQTPHQTLSRLAAAHDLQLHFTNVVNQDLTMRGSGSLTFDINAAAANTGRDAPTKYATGPVYDGWRIVGPPTWDTASSGRLIGAMLSSAQMTLSNWTGITNGSFHVIVDGTAHDVTGINLSSVTNMTGVASAINARLTVAAAGATMSFDPNDQVQRFQLFSNSNGTGSTVSFLTAAASGTDISAQLLMTSGATSSNSGVNSYTQAGVAAGSKDPLLYVICYVDVSTQSDGTTMGKVRPTCGIHNSWMNVAASSTGNPGAPGPAGYANDPQAVIYRPALLDGSHPLLDYGAMFDYSIAASSNPVVSPSGGCESYIAASSCWNIAASTGDRVWQVGGTHVYSCSPAGACTPPTATVIIPATNGNGGASQYVAGHYYGDIPSGNRNGNPQYVSFEDTLIGFIGAPAGTFDYGAYMMPTSQGSGTHNFSFRVTQPKYESWYTFTPEGFAPWSDGTTMSVSPFEIAFDQGSFGGERLYWEETGVVPPIRLTAQAATVTAGGPSNYGSEYYSPMGRGNLIGGGGAGERPELDVLNEFAGACWYTMSASDCLHMRSLSLSAGIYPVSTMLNEITGYVPVTTNGPPTGPNGTGQGGSYPTLGAPFPNLVLEDFNPNGGLNSGTALRLNGTPINLGWGAAGALSKSYNYVDGFWEQGASFQQDHEPEFAGLSYRLYGNPQFLDMIYFHAQRALNNHNSKGYTDPTDGLTYNGVFVGTQQVRGGHWVLRDRTLAVAFGDDTRPERNYYNDALNEGGQGWFAVMKTIDGSATNAYENSLAPPGNSGWGEVFMDDFGVISGAQAYALLRSPVAKTFSDKYSRLWNAACGHPPSDWPAYMGGGYCTLYVRAYAWHNGNIPLGGLQNGRPNTGIGLNTTDATDYADAAPYSTFTAGSGIVQSAGVPGQLTAGDLVKNLSVGEQGYPSIDQLDPQTWYEIMSPNGSTFQIRCPLGHAVDATCPTPGTPFTGFTSGGSPLSYSQVTLSYRYQYDPPGFAVDYNYVPYAWQGMSYLNAIGYNMSPAINYFTTQYGTINKDNGPSYILDPTVVVP